MYLFFTALKLDKLKLALSYLLRPALATVFAIAIVTVFVTAFATAFATGAEAAKIKGDYKKIGKIPKANSLKQVELLEFINYKCIHCYQFREGAKPLLKKYGARVKLVSVPLVFGSQSDQPVRLFIIAEKQGKGELANDAIFKANFVDKLDIEDQKVLAQIATILGLKQYYQTQRNANWVTRKLAENKKLSIKAKVNATPTIVLQKSLKTSAKTTLEAFITDLTSLIDQLLI